MAITFDPIEREATLLSRGLDFADAGDVLDGRVFEFVDDRFDYGETRITTIGVLAGRMIVVVWTLRGGDRHIISMRKANEREQQKYRDRVG